MACGFTILNLATFEGSGVRLTGTYDATQPPCATIQVAARFPGTIGTLRTTADASSGNWTARFHVNDPKILKEWCESANLANPVLLPIEVACVDGAGMVTCTHTETLPVHCCPAFLLLAPEIGDCINHHEGAIRLYKWTILVTWPPGYADTVDLKLNLEQVNNPYSPVRRELTDASPASDSYTIEAHLRADRDYVGVFECESDADCSDHTQTIATFHVPACSCGTAPSPRDFLSLTDSQGAVIADPNGVGCVTGAKVRVHAASGEVTWTATTFQGPIAPVSVDALTVDVPLPADGTRVIITATLTDGACEFLIPVSARRCPGTTPTACVPVPGDYALVVSDRAGRTIAVAGCVEEGPAIITAPTHEGEVTWKIDGQDAAAVTGSPRTLEVTLNDTNDHTVTADVGVGACIKTVSRVIRKCAGIPAQKENFWPKLPWCLFLLIAALILFFLGHIVFAIGTAILLPWPCYILLATALAVPTGGWSYVVAAVLYFIVFVVTIIGLVCWILGTVLLLVWLFWCRGCVGGVKSPYSMCEMLQLCAFVLTFGGLISFVIDVFIHVASGFSGAVCGVPMTGAFSVIVAAFTFLALLIDLFGLLIPTLIVYYAGNAIGCFNNWPIRFIPIIPISLPSYLSVRCPDEITPGGE